MDTDKTLNGGTMNEMDEITIEEITNDKTSNEGGMDDNNETTHDI